MSCDQAVGLIECHGIVCCEGKDSTNIKMYD